MIKISKIQCPSQLTDSLKNQLTAQYISRKDRVWNKPFIKLALLESSNGKCAYCECRVDIEASYMEVDHYYDKNTNPQLVVQWDNLLPSCKRCNGNKSNFDTKNRPFINPATMNPKDHMCMRIYRFTSKTNEGKNTIEVLRLNDTQRIVMPRAMIIEALNDQVEELKKSVENFRSRKSAEISDRNKINDFFYNLMSEGLPESQYAGTVATHLINNPSFDEAVNLWRIEGQWSRENESIYSQMGSIAFELKV